MLEILEKTLQGSAPVIVFLCFAIWIAYRVARAAITAAKKFLKEHAIPDYQEKTAMMKRSLDQRAADGERVDLLIGTVTKLGDGVSQNGVRLDRHEEILSDLPDRTAEAALRKLETA